MHSANAIVVNIRGGGHVHVEHDGGARVTHGPKGSAHHHAEGAPASHQRGGASHGGAPHGTGAPRAHNGAHHGGGRAHEPWKVHLKGKLYKVTATGGERRIERLANATDETGEVVWSGQRRHDHRYSSHRSSLDPTFEAELLRHVDEQDPHRKGHDEAAVPPSSGTVPSAHRPAREASAGPAPEAEHTAPRQTPTRAAPAKKTAAEKPAVKKAAAKKTTGKKPAAKKAAAKKAAAKKAAAKKTAAKAPSTAPAVEKPPSKRTAAAEKPAASKPESGKVEVAPHTRKPPTRRQGPGSKPSPVDDEKVMTELLQGLQRETPDKAANTYAAMRKAWFAGAREDVLAWVKEDKAREELSLARAYADWSQANVKRMGELLRRPAPAQAAPATGRAA